MKQVVQDGETRWHSITASCVGSFRTVLYTTQVSVGTRACLEATLEGHYQVCSRSVQALRQWQMILKGNSSGKRTRMGFSAL